MSCLLSHELQKRLKDTSIEVACSGERCGEYDPSRQAEYYTASLYRPYRLQAFRTISVEKAVLESSAGGTMLNTLARDLIKKYANER